MTGARVVLLCGLPGSGKTTTARRIAEGVLLERLEVRNRDPHGTVVISREHLLGWVDLFDAPSTEEQALFDT